MANLNSGRPEMLGLYIGSINGSLVLFSLPGIFGFGARTSIYYFGGTPLFCYRATFFYYGVLTYYVFTYYFLGYSVLVYNVLIYYFFGYYFCGYYTFGCYTFG